MTISTQAPLLLSEVNLTQKVSSTSALSPLDATVIIPTYQSWDQLQVCLDRLACQTLNSDQFEIIVVNNDPSDPTPDGFRLPANARMLSEAKPGSYAARNRGIDEAKAGLLFFTDSDCQPDPEYLEAGLKMAQAHPEIGRFGGNVVLIPNGDDWTTTELYDVHLGLEQQKWVERGRAVTANLIVRRRVMDHVGRFNDTVLSGGDMEWSDRAQAAGEPILFASDAIVRHPARESLGEHLSKARRIEGARLRRNSQRGAVNYVPPIHKLIPSFKTLKNLLGSPDLTTGQAFKVWGVHYVIRVIKITETIRLLWLRRPDQRK
ncbi:glycosyltransferase [uncultured Ruegeria sp.]|uniref:glycosyltransferase family 2 protein n=1 Tax=uncultured Ruegeria sp. TaxID=259304 RepID=UPI0026174396|nr:glycosyltransferase [uncultured Ruegeria sp.]